MTSKNREILSVVVDNNSGVLARVASLFSQRGYNIDSLTVSATDDPKISRITLVVHGSEQVINQIIQQTSKLEEVHDVYTLHPHDSITRELLLIKLKADDAARPLIHEIANIYRASIVDLSPNSMVLELTGNSYKIDGFIDVVSKYGVIELCRTGITALERGTEHIPLHKIK